MNETLTHRLGKLFQRAARNTYIVHLEERHFFGTVKSVDAVTVLAADVSSERRRRRYRITVRYVSKCVFALAGNRQCILLFSLNN